MKATRPLTGPPLAITATAQAKTYGNLFTPNGATQFTSHAGDLVNGDTIGSVTLSSTGYPATAAAGSYNIVPSAAVFSHGSARNYTITYNNGTLTVNNAALT